MLWEVDIYPAERQPDRVRDDRGAGGTSQCTQLIANTITFSGGATFNNNCAGTGTQTISLTNGQLVM